MGKDGFCISAPWISLRPVSYTHLDVYKRQILFGDDSDIKEGTKVARTGKMAGIPVGEAYIGRIVDALGSPIDGKGEILYLIHI